MFGQRLKQARMARGLSQQQLADPCGVSKMAISNYETGKDMPGSDVLLRLADTLRVAIDYFFRTISIELGSPACRKSCNLSDTELQIVINDVQDHAERYLETEALFPDNPTPQLIVPDSLRVPVRTLDDVEDRADDLRRFWMLGTYPIDNLTELLEDHGIRVFYVDAPDSFDGCTFPDGDHPVIVVNRSRCGDRLRFDLAHELGHLVLRFSALWDEAKIEKAAHRFAGAFLVPGSTARRELGDRRASITLRELHDLKHKYGLSIGAWIYRAYDLQIIGTKTKGELYALLKKHSVDKVEPGVPYRLEKTNKHVRLVARAYADGMISPSRAAELLAARIDELDILFTDCVLQGTAAHCTAD